MALHWARNTQCVEQRRTSSRGACTARVWRHAGAGRRVCLRAQAAAADSSVVSDSVKFQKLLLTIMDSNEFLSDGSKQAVNTAASLALKDAGSVTVLIIDEPGTQTREPEKQVQNIKWHLQNSGLEEFQVFQRSTTQPASVLIGDVADEVLADMVVVSSEAVHSKHVDANQLSEFVSCPILVLP